MSPVFGKAQANHQKTAWSLEFNVRAMVEEYGLENVGFMTLTTAKWMDKKQLSAEWNSLNSNVLRDRYPDYIAVVERGARNGRLHLHVIVALGWDCRTDFDFALYEAAGALWASGDHVGARKLWKRLGNPRLKDEWKFLRRTLTPTKAQRAKGAKGYKFGRHELVPIKSTASAVSSYVGKYVGKHLFGRTIEDKGMRLVRYSAGRAKATTRFMFNTKGSRCWRELVASVAGECNFTDLADFAEAFGPKWAYGVKQVIHDREVIEHPRNQDPVWHGIEVKPLPGIEPRRAQVSALLDDITLDIRARREERERRRMAGQVQSRLWMERTQNDP